MNKYIYILLGLIIINSVKSQDISTNRNPQGLEHNLLFNATSRYIVTQTGSATLNLNTLFDGRFGPSYTSSAPSVGNETVIIIENLPQYHTQAGAWIGWSTRWWPAKNFKIEGYEIYYNPTGWKTIVDYSSTDYSGLDFVFKVPSGIYTKLKFTFITATGDNGRLGVSELFYIHPEAQAPYAGLFETSNDKWIKNGNDIYYNNGNVGIGTTSPVSMLHIKGSGNTGATESFRVDNSINGFALVVEDDYQVHTRMQTIGANYFGNDAPANGLIVEGNVLIGKNSQTNPEYKLDVAGIIRANEIKVNTTGADFVFYEDYKLRPITELEQYINQNKHLPEIPTAEEVAEEGISLGEMNAKLLQKIEEQTLYIIELNKRIEELEKRVIGE